MKEITYNEFLIFVIDELTNSSYIAKLDYNTDSIDNHFSIDVNSIYDQRVSMKLYKHSNRVTINRNDSADITQHTVVMATEGVETLINWIYQWLGDQTDSNINYSEQETPDPLIFNDSYPKDDEYFISGIIDIVYSVRPAIIYNSLIKLYEDDISDLEHSLAFLLGYASNSNRKSMSPSEFVLVRGNHYWPVTELKSLDGHNCYAIASKKLDLYRPDKEIINETIKNYVNKVS